MRQKSKITNLPINQELHRMEKRGQPGRESIRASVWSAASLLSLLRFSVGFGRY